MADRQQSDPRLVDARHQPGVGRTEYRVLDELDRVHLHPGADVEQYERPLRTGQDRGEGRPPNARKPAKAHDRRGDNRPASPGRHHGVGPIARQTVHGGADGRLRIGPPRDRIGHRDPVLRGQHIDPVANDRVEATPDLVGHRPGADEEEREVRIRLQSQQSAVYHDGGGAIPAEEVNGDPRAPGQSRDFLRTTRTSGELRGRLDWCGIRA